MNTELTTWYWRQACETLDTMQMALVRGNYNNVVTMGYQAMEQGAKALLAANDTDAGSHRAVQILVSRELVKAGKIGPEYSKAAGRSDLDKTVLCCRNFVCMHETRGEQWHDTTLRLTDFAELHTLPSRPEEEFLRGPAPGPRPAAPSARRYAPEALRAALHRAHLARRERRVAPHARGYAEVVKGRPGSPEKRPARAGIRRCATATLPTRRGPPRTRGDTPWTREGPVSRGENDPRARVCAFERQNTSGSSVERPARAGMRPYFPPYARPERGTPRTRGDGPRRRLQLHCLSSASPQTRGYTQSERQSDAPALSRPALAGTHRLLRSLVERAFHIAPHWRGQHRSPRERAHGRGSSAESVGRIEVFLKEVWVG